MLGHLKLAGRELIARGEPAGRTGSNSNRVGAASESCVVPNWIGVTRASNKLLVSCGPVG